MPDHRSLPRLVFGAPMMPDPDLLASLTAEALATGWLTNRGALHMRLEQALETPGDPLRSVSLTSSGTMALMLALALGRLPQGAEVITTPLTFAATAQAIAWSGLRPVFADIDPVTLNLCPDAAEAAITPRTAAILPVHFLGVPCDVTALAGIARRHGLWLVYDAAHAFGMTLEGRPIGHFGDASAFSLHATKLLHCCEGGYVSTGRDLTDDLRRLRNFGLSAGVPAGPGINGKMSELHAAMGLALLPRLQDEVAARQRLRRSYDAAIADLPGIRLHGNHPGVTGASANLNYYTLRMASELRGRLHLALAEGGVFARDHFPLLCGPGCHWAGQPIITAAKAAPVAPVLGPELLCLPFHGRIGDEDAARIVAIIRAVTGS